MIMDTEISIRAADVQKLGEALDARGISYFRSKSLADVSTVLIQLGGGAGAAALIVAIGSALKSYFEGLGSLEIAKKATIVANGISVNVDPEEIDSAMIDLIKALKGGDGNLAPEKAKGS